MLTDPSADLGALPDEQRSRVLSPAEFIRIVQFGEVPGKSLVAGETPVDEATVAAVRGILEGVQGRPRPGKGRLLDELPLLVRDIALNLRERAPQPDIQAAVLILACSFVRALEERGLLDRNLLGGEGAEETERAFMAGDPARASNAYLSHVLASVAAHPAGQAVLEEGHERLWSAPRSNAASRAALDFFRQRDPAGKRRWSFAADPWSDLYQEISPTQQKEHAMVTTPAFVEKTMLDLTLTPALEELGAHAVRVMDPACGSGLVLVMAFERLHERMLQASPGVDREASARLALDRIHGADISPISVLVTRIQLTLAYLRRAGITRFADAPGLPLHIVAADSLLAKPDFGASAGLEPLTTHGYEVVVCEPLFVTCKDATRREQYRARYRSAGPASSLAAPFIERCFQLAG